MGALARNIAWLIRSFHLDLPLLKLFFRK
jgi:hypothetical protein